MRGILCGAILILNMTLGAISSWAQNANDFTDGIGYYFRTNGRYQILYWQHHFGRDMLNGAIQNINKAIPQAIIVKRDVRFFSYGIDYERATGIMPPTLLLGFCTINPTNDKNPLNGAFPIRVKPIQIGGGGVLSSGGLPIYELVLPDFTRAPNFNAPYWSIGLQSNCDAGWLFKFEK